MTSCLGSFSQVLLRQLGIDMKLRTAMTATKQDVEKSEKTVSPSHQFVPNFKRVGPCLLLITQYFGIIFLKEENIY